MDRLTSSVAITTWLNPLLMLNVNLQNVNQDHYLSLLRPQDCVISQIMSVAVAAHMKKKYHLWLLLVVY